MMVFPQTINDKVKVQNLQNFETHDGTAYSGTFCIGNTKIALVQNSGQGGDTEYRFLSDEAEAMFNKFLNDNKIKSVLAERYKGMNVDTETILSEFMEEFMQIKVDKQTISRLQKKAIVFTVPGSSAFNQIAWKQPLAKIVAAGYLDKIQETYNKIKRELKTGEVIVNTNLAKLGITI